MKKLFVIVLISVSAACSSQEISDSNEFSEGEKLAELTDKKLKEASGLAASKQNSGLLWTHNDSGNGPEVFLVDRQLNIKLTCTIKGVSNRDWEDISIGPGPVAGKTYLYVADIGDNLAKYQYKLIYRFEEPLADPSTNEITITDFDVITFQLDGPRKDTEAMLVHPITKDIYVVSKREDPVHVYELKYPYSTKDSLTAKDIATLPMTLIVGGDFSSGGNEILLKNYKNVFYWKGKANQSPEDIFKQKAGTLQYKEEPQGEAITWAPDGSGYYTISEKVKNKKSFLYFYKRN